MPYATGDVCENLICNQTDAQYGCWGPNDPTFCTYSNTVASCPYTCNICNIKLVSVVPPIIATTTSGSSTAAQATGLQGSSTGLQRSSSSTTSAKTLKSGSHANFKLNRIEIVFLIMLFQF